MSLQASQRGWREILAVSLVSIILYQFNMLFLFLIPVQLLHVRRGDRELLAGAGIVFAATVAIALSRIALAGAEALTGAIIVIEAAVPLLLLGGLAAVNLKWPGRPARYVRSVKLIIVSSAIGLIAAPFLISGMRDNGFEQFVLEQIEAFTVSLNTAAAGDPSMMYSFADLLQDTEALAALITEILLRTFVFSYFVLIAGSVWVGEFVGSKTMDHVTYPLIRNYRVPERWVWVFLLAWAGILLDVVAGVGGFRYAAWNLGLIMLFLYGIEGVGIVRHWLVARGVSGWIRMALGVGVAIMLFWPGANVLVMIILPGIGVSETWIRYRKSAKE